MDRSTVKAFCSSFRDYLRLHGFSVTAQRQVVLDEILTYPRHFDVEELVRRVRNSGRAASRATVYRTIVHLEQSGLIRKIDFDHPHAHYEFTGANQHHEHMVCEKCGAVAEFTDSALEERILSIAAKQKFHLTKHTVQLFGSCRKCHEKKNDQKSR